MGHIVPEGPSSQIFCFRFCGSCFALEPNSRVSEQTPGTGEHWIQSGSCVMWTDPGSVSVTRSGDHCCRSRCNAGRENPSQRAGRRTLRGEAPRMQTSPSRRAVLCLLGVLRSHLGIRAMDWVSSSRLSAASLRVRSAWVKNHANLQLLLRWKS